MTNTASDGRAVKQAFLDAGQMAGAFMALVSLASFLGNFLIITVGWAALIEWAQSLPAWALSALVSLGQGLHAVVEAYRATVHPYVRLLFSWLSLDLTAWQIDLLFIFIFSILSAARPVSRSTRDALDRKPNAFRRAGSVLIRAVNWPFGVVIDVGYRIGEGIDAAFGRITGDRLRPIDWLYWKLPSPVDGFVLRTVWNLLALATVWGVDQIIQILLALHTDA